MKYYKWPERTTMALRFNTTIGYSNVEAKATRYVIILTSTNGLRPIWTFLILTDQNLCTSSHPLISLSWWYWAQDAAEHKHMSVTEDSEFVSLKSSNYNNKIIERTYMWNHLWTTYYCCTDVLKKLVFVLLKKINNNEHPYCNKLILPSLSLHFHSSFSP